ncbi:MAG: S41 family peptidase [Terracidiphilus sp.]|nr:S41 family peptidase [Terracidiphilus sp.]MDR3776048.1 S41 family peptidase [Terracidiphilus sp.]
MSRFFQRFVFVLSTVIFAALGLGFVLGEFGWFGVHAGGQQDGAYRQMRVYQEVLKKVQSDYVTEPNINDVTTGALHGLLESLDSDSSYLSPTEYKIYKERPVAGVAQVGIVVSKRYGYATVVSVLPGSPAAKEHLSDGDVIESIGGQSTRELSLEVIRLMLEGKPGSTVTISVVRPRKADPDKLTLTRTVVTPAALSEQQYENSTILYLKPGALTAARVDEIAAHLKAAGKGHKVLLDLRDCSDGEAQDGLRLANFFVKQGTLATLEGQKVPRQTFTADPAKFLTDAPLAVLVNSGTYGAAELTAAAIADAKRGDLVGERTFGEGSVQKTIELPDGSALLLTVAKYQTPGGKKIQDEAVTPGVVVGQALDEELDEEAPPAKGDEPLNKALELLKAKNS